MDRVLNMIYCDRCGNDVTVPFPYGRTKVMLCGVCRSEWFRLWKKTRPRKTEWTRLFNKFVQSKKECVVFT